MAYTNEEINYLLETYSKTKNFNETLNTFQEKYQCKPSVPWFRKLLINKGIITKNPQGGSRSLTKKQLEDLVKYFEGDITLLKELTDYTPIYLLAACKKARINYKNFPFGEKHTRPKKIKKRDFGKYYKVYGF